MKKNRLAALIRHPVYVHKFDEKSIKLKSTVHLCNDGIFKCLNVNILN